MQGLYGNVCMLWMLLIVISLGEKASVHSAVDLSTENAFVSSRLSL